MSMLIPPHGGVLMDLFLDSEAALDEARAREREVRSWDLTERQLCDIELILNGAFSPLQGFMGRDDYESVLHGMRLADGTLWPIPITLDVSRNFAVGIKAGDTIALRDPEGVAIALMEIGDIWERDSDREDLHLFRGAGESRSQPRAATGEICLGGPLKGLIPLRHYDFRQYRSEPRILRTIFMKRGWQTIAAYPIERPMHRMHVERTARLMRELDANLLIHPIVGHSIGDEDHYFRIRCYEHVVKRYAGTAPILDLLPLSPRGAGVREILWQAIVHKNYGCTHLIVDEEAMTSGEESVGRTERERVEQGAEEIGVKVLFGEPMRFMPERSEYRYESEMGLHEPGLRLSKDDLIERLDAGKEIPEWFSFPEVVAELRRIHPPRNLRGFTIFFTGLSGAGKSTIANAVYMKLREKSGRAVTLLDGDLVRKHLSSGLGFSKAHRDMNVMRIGYVASEITRHRGIAICAPIAPYRETRRQVRHMVQAVGEFIEVYISTPLDVCERRDRKGLYAKARAGLIKEFTGIDDPYEVPEQPEVIVDTSRCTPDEAANQILATLMARGIVSDETSLVQFREEVHVMKKPKDGTQSR